VSAIDGAFTVQDVVYAALRKSGVMGLGQTPYPSGADVLDAQNDFSDMLAEWNAETYLTWAKVDLAFVSDGRAGPGLGGAYTTGPGANYSVTPRPDRVEAAYLRILNSSGQAVDQPLKQIPARESYARVALKQLVAFPKAYFYDSAATTVAATSFGNVYFYPWPTASLYEMHIIVKSVFPLTLPLNTDLSGIPPQYRGTMKFCLAQRLRQAYGKGLRPDTALDKLARAGLTKLRQSNVQVPELTMPQMVLGRGSLYNVYGDIFY
jgi:hypothetical protein